MNLAVKTSRPALNSEPGRSIQQAPGLLGLYTETVQNTCEYVKQNRTKQSCSLKDPTAPVAQPDFSLTQPITFRPDRSLAAAFHTGSRFPNKLIPASLRDFQLKPWTTSSPFLPQASLKDTLSLHKTPLDFSVF